MAAKSVWVFVSGALLCQGLAWSAGTAMQPVSNPTIALQPLVIKAVVPETPEVITKPDGTATVNFTVQGIGNGTCDLAIAQGGSLGYVTAPITPQSGFPKTVTLTFAKPGVYSINVYGLQCAGNVTFKYNVKPYPDYPCSLYPGFKKENYFNNPDAPLCVPTSPPANSVDASRFNCGKGLVFTNAGGYVFGCLPPGVFAH